MDKFVLRQKAVIHFMPAAYGKRRLRLGRKLIFVFLSTEEPVGEVSARLNLWIRNIKK